MFFRKNDEYELKVEKKKTVYGIQLIDKRTGKVIKEEFYHPHVAHKNEKQQDQNTLHHVLRKFLTEVPSGARIDIRGVPPKTILEAFLGR
jgi:hypothetical protein